MHVSTRLCFLTRWLYDDKNTHPLMYDDNTTHPLMYDDNHTHPLMYDDNHTHMHQQQTAVLKLPAHDCVLLWLLLTRKRYDDNNTHMHQQQTAVLKLPAHDFTPLAPLPPNANADIRYTSTD